MTCLPEAFPVAIFLPIGGPRQLRVSRRNPGTLYRRIERRRARDRGSHRRVALRKTHRRPLSQHRGDYRGRWRTPREISQDAYPGRSFYYEKFYFTPGDLGFKAWPTTHGKIGRLRLLGPVVSGSGPPNDSAGRRNSILSDRDRVAPIGKSEIRLRPAFRLGNDAAQSCDREWVFRCGR